MSDTSYNIYVSAGEFDSPFFTFYTDAAGSQELTPTNTLYLDASYNFYRLDNDTTHPFYISDVSYGQPSTSNISLSGDGSYNTGIVEAETFTLGFTGLDTSGTLYYYCTNHATMVNTFTLLSTSPDVVGPILTGISPNLNEVDVDVTGSFQFTFDETVTIGSGNILIYNATTNTLIQTLDIVNSNTLLSGNDVNVSLPSNLPASTPLYVNIESGVFQDSAGNDFVGLDSSLPDTGMRFTTNADIISPTLLTVSPTLNATDISINTNLGFTFSEDIVENIGNIEVYLQSDNTLIQAIDVSSSAVTISGSDVTVVLSADLSYSTGVYVNIDSNAFQDLCGNNFNGLDSSLLNSGMRFTTRTDPDIPYVTSISPLLNATDISINTNLEFTFSEDVSAGSGNILIYDEFNNLLQTIDVSSSDVTISGNQMIVNPPTDLPYETSMYVNVDSGTLQDLSGIDFAGLDSSSFDTGMRFTTDIDYTLPRIISVLPLRNATDISINTTLEFTFSEDLSAGVGQISLYDYSEETLIETIDVSSSAVTIVGNKVTVNPPTGLLYNTNYYVNIDPGTFQDFSGNDFVGLSSDASNGMVFTTELDVTIPVLTSISPILNATDVSINTNLAFTFSEDVLGGSGNILLYDSSDNTLLQTIDVNSSEVTISGSQVVVTPSTDLSFNRSYYVNIDASGFQDLRANYFTGLDSSASDTGMRFTTEPDVTLPTIISISPLLNAPNVSNNANLEFTFSEDVVAGSGNIFIYDSSNTLLQTIDISSSYVTTTGSQVVVDPPSDLSYSTTVYVNIDASGFQDLRGNYFTGLDSSSSDTGMRFTIEEEPDIIAPTLISYSPILNVTDISVNTNLEFTFSEDVSGVNGNIIIYRSSDNTVMDQINASSSNVTITGSQVVVNPTTDLSFNTSLYVNIESGAFQDGAGNAFSGLDSSGADTGMRFTTELDVTIPVITSISPILNATDLSINTNLEFIFSEEVVNGSGNILIYRSSDDRIMNTIDISSSEVTISGNRVVVNPPTDLSYNTSFYVNIDASGFQDLRGNYFTGLDSSGADTGMRFTTAPDITIPVITSISPTLNATSVAINTNLEFTFSEDVLPVSGNVLLYDASNNELLHTFDVNGADVSISGNQVVVVNPSTDLSYNRPFYVNIDSGAFQDLRANAFTGLDSSVADSGMRFTTERDLVLPTISSHLPILNATDVSSNTSLEFVFSEEVILGSGNIYIRRTSNDIIVQVIDVTSENVSVSGTQVIINPDRDLPVGLSLYVDIDSGTFQDLRGNDFAGLDSSSPGSGIRFVTAESGDALDIINPTLNSISPALNATAVPVESLLVFAFSERPILDVQGHIYIYQASDNKLIQKIDITGPNVTISGTQVIVKPPVLMPFHSSLYVNIDSNALLDSGGNNFAGLDSSSENTGMRFTTVDPAQTRLFDIIRVCQDKKCQQNIRYSRLNTGGNDPSMSKAMRYAQYVRTGKGNR